ncbi:MAG: DUF1028 domain-containing protein [Hyphomicrobiales bacterium]
MTFTVIARDEEKGLLGIAISTSGLSVGARCPFIRANVGAVSSQAFTDPGIGPIALELLGLGLSPTKVLIDLSQSDPHHAYRQIGMVDRHGRAAVHTGANAMTCRGHVTGPNYLVMGNHLKSDQVVEDMNRAFLGSKGQLLEDRLLKAVTAGRDAGGDLDGHRTACMLVYDTEPYARTDLRVDFVPKTTSGPDAVDALTALLDKYRPLIPYYKVRPHNPTIAGWLDWLKERGAPFHD